MSIRKYASQLYNYVSNWLREFLDVSVIWLLQIVAGDDIYFFTFYLLPLQEGIHHLSITTSSLNLAARRYFSSVMSYFCHCLCIF